MADKQRAAERVIEKVIKRLTGAEVDALVADGGRDSAEFKGIAEAVMAWYQLLMASGVVKRDERAVGVLASSMLVLGTLVKYAYALGVRRGRRQVGKRGKKPLGRSIG